MKTKRIPILSLLVIRLSSYFTKYIYFGQQFDGRRSAYCLIEFFYHSRSKFRITEKFEKPRIENLICGLGDLTTIYVVRFDGQVDWLFNQCYHKKYRLKIPAFDPQLGLIRGNNSFPSSPGYVNLGKDNEIIRYQC